MSEDIIKMINQISVSDFLVANPNSSSCNKAFKKIFKGTDFLKEFYIISNKTFERLAKIAYVSNDITKNTIFITGYRGCGKTCFMNFLDKLIKDEFKLNKYEEYMDATVELMKDIYDNQKYFVKYNFYREEQEEIEQVQKEYEDSNKKIEKTLASSLKIYKEENDGANISDYLNNCVTGKSIYLNFEKGINSESIPFNLKFLKQIMSVINDIIKTESSESNMSPFSLLYDLYQNNEKAFENTFEYRNCIFKFMNFVNEKLINADKFTEVRLELEENLNVMSLEQLMMVLVLIYISKEISFDGNSYRKVFILLDNMDIIYQQTMLEQSMHSYSLFIENMNSLMEELENKGIKEWGIIYENITFIFAMRETTAMQIADHFIDGIEQNVAYFDMSLDTNKSLIVEKKYHFLKKYKNKIENEMLLETFENVYRICTDYYTKYNIFPMFNNDFKRAIVCISKICEENKSILEQHRILREYNRPLSKNGARGIIFRLIYNKFKSEHYFEMIGIEPYHYKFTPARIILTILYNFLPDNENEDSERLYLSNLNMRTLFEYAGNVLDTEMFINAIMGMFSLKSEKMWNHLLTFDNVKDVSYKGLKEFIMKYIDKKPIYSDVKLRITDAGKNYIKDICTHFEFFACRFYENSKPLFCKENFVYQEKNNKYEFEKILETVYKSVEKCCLMLEEYNEKIEKMYTDTPNKSLLQSKFVFRNKAEEIGILHEERIIHKHITYIDNFRIYLVQYIYSDRCVDINKRIIKILKKYIELMNGKYMSERSRILKKEFEECIKYIEEKKQYKDTSIEVSEKSYKELRDNGCL